MQVTSTDVERMTPRRLVVFADGTWNKPDQKDRGKRKPTNVSKLARAVLPQDGSGTSQIVFYHQGVGTHWSLSDRWLGGGFGVGLLRNVLDIYQWIVYNYAEGDELLLFGFSRGAYTVRSLAGLIEQVGLLPKNHAFYIPEAQRLYVRRGSYEQVSQFRRRHNVRIPRITFLGAWDTVGALGVPVPLFNWLSRKRYEFHEVGLGTCVEHARHALAIDEKRRPFQPALWRGPSYPGQTVEQRWFPGVHSNIGGGYARDGLANSALHWIAMEAQVHGLEVDRKFLAHYKPYFGHELRQSYGGVYRLQGAYSRPIGKTSPGTETIDRSAYARYHYDPTYRPKNLVEFIARQNIDVDAMFAKP
jgi:uncharacterized protein (DUF2235 family)